MEVKRQELREQPFAVGRNQAPVFLRPGNGSNDGSNKGPEHIGAELALSLFSLTLQGNGGRQALIVQGSLGQLVLERIGSKGDRENGNRSQQLGQYVENAQPVRRISLFPPFPGARPCCVTVHGVTSVSSDECPGGRTGGNSLRYPPNWRQACRHGEDVPCTSQVRGTR